jgi:hypothetical protein
MPSHARQSCQRILDDVWNLLSHHPKIRNPGVGAPLGDTKPLLNACTVLSYTAWEVYVEDLLIEAVPFLQAQSTYISPKLRKRIAERVKGDPWRLASGRWKSEVEKAVKSIAIGDVGSWGINTANAKNVNDAFEEVFGGRLLDGCSWQGMSATKVKRYVDQLVQRRGAIVHRGVPDPDTGRLSLAVVKDWANWVNNLCDRVDVLSGDALSALTGGDTW